MSKSKFIKIYSDLPDSVRKEIIVVIDEKPYSWNSAYLEVHKETELGKKIIQKMESMGLLDE
ncbi:hypothetical protein HOK51_03980 [Candidatus Woesearchaeota archaeon]|jgi:hypothetical protein|nr:hypothetical protein [Candidatus Woesearchaeota archaeon]MBT6518982.1 hypothetical protein [Candidatus Woesearchaeota archaeon]MBT7368347.1 hypothetical protein [Candidatus Woesearchaeota archaeon]